MEYLDARRLPGPNVLWERTGAILDIACEPAEIDRVVAFCEARLGEMLPAVGWENETVTHRRLAGGVSIAFSAPLDVLYAASELAEWLWTCCEAERDGNAAPDFDEAAAALRASIAEEANPALLALGQAALLHGVAFLWDDDEVSVGHGGHSTTWPFRELPAPDELDWSGFSDVPVGFVTGTNGKTTSARIAKHILRTAGLRVGLSCTDWVAVDDRIVDRDDWSGPGGARMVLRQPDIDAAILETARGGLLRRGLGVTRADASLITNIAEDHLGDFGSQSMRELLEIKWVISHAVAESGLLVLNADDPLLVEKSKEFGGTIAWFSLDADNPLVTAHCAAGGRAFVLDDGDLVRIEGAVRDTICSAAEVPITLGGAAAHNVANALGAAALTEQLGMSLDDIRRGLRSMSQAANPGRSNLHDIRGFRVLVDFAHNPEAMQALFAMARALPARRRVLCFGQAGDRTDAQIRELARSAWSIGLDLACIAELEKYLRGREPREVFGILREELLACGARDEQIRYFPNESESFDSALGWAAEGDLVVILDLGRNSDIQAKLDALVGG